jgi:hypothetical protein
LKMLLKIRNTSIRMQVCWYHALSNEKEEMMGVLIGQKKGTSVHFSTLKAIKRMTKQKDRVEIDDSQLVAASTFAASLQATNPTLSSITEMEFLNGIFSRGFWA